MSAAVALAVAIARLVCYLPPVDAPIDRPFIPEPCAYCAGGHRGVEYDVAAGTSVRAAASGVVTFAGVVVGVRYLVVLDDDGLTATYGMIASAARTTGQRVTVGEVIAVSGPTLYFGLRTGETYVDPQLYLGVSRRRPRLIPSNGRPGRSSPLLPPTCPADGSAR